MIRITDVDKIYHLGEIGSGTLYRDLQSWWARKKGRPDPNLKIGQEKLMQEGAFYALQGINLDVRRGERLGIIGGNGAGKSTLLKLISRITAPSAGKIELFGRITSMLEVGTGFHSEMTGRENIYLNGAILGMNKKEIDEVLEDIISFSEVRDFIDTPVKRYSSGMYVKLAFSVAAHLQSEIVIMDEVLAVGDLAFQKKCIEKMLQTSLENDRTILYVSHNMQTVRDLCTRCIVLDRGHLIYDGDTEKAIAYYSEYLMKERGVAQDYASLVRQKPDLTGLCRIESVSVPDSSVAEGGTLHFSVGFHAKEADKRILMRIIVGTPSGQIVGMTSSEEILLSEGRHSVTYAFDTENLAPGVYTFDLIVLEYDGNYEKRHDYISRAVSFTVEEGMKTFGRLWESRSWGHVRFDKVRIEHAEKEDEEQ